MIRLISFILFVLSSFTASAQTAHIKFEHFGTDEGLSQSQVNCILQDSEGFLWICTFDGLNRYDGYNFKVYYHDPFDINSIASNDLNYIIEDKKGKLWVCTQNNGVEILDKSTDKFTHLIDKPGYPKGVGCENVETIYEDRNGIIWIGTFDSGLIEYDLNKNSFKHYNNKTDDPYSLSNNTVYSILEDLDGIMWIGTRDGLNILDRQTRKFINYKNTDGAFLKLKENIISKLYLDKQNNLWVGANHYLEKYDRINNKFQNIEIPFDGMEKAKGYRIWSILGDASGTIWLGTTRGLIRYDEKENHFSIYRSNSTDPFSLSDNYIWTIIQDYSGNIWLGTDVGVNKFNPRSKKFNHISSRELDSQFDNITYVWAILQDSRDNVWIGAENGLYRWDINSNNIIEYKHNPYNRNSIHHNTVYAIKEDSKNNIWILMHGGLDKYDHKKDIFYHCSDLPDWDKYTQQHIAYKFIIDHKGIIWIGLYGFGVVQFDPAANTFSNFQFNSRGDEIKFLSTARRFLEDKDHNVWICTEDGLIEYLRDKNILKVFRNDPMNPTTISSNKIITIFEDHNGNLWVGTDGKGLNFFDKTKQTFKSYFTKNGLQSNSIYGILEDESGNLWLSSNNGLSKFNPGTTNFTYFDVTDGLQSREFNAGAYFKNKKGYMFFGGINGINIFHPDSIKYNTHIPQVVISEIKIMNKRIIEAPILSTGSLEVSYSQNFISFQFAALDFTSPEKNQYKYKMQGFDKNWIDAGNKRFVDYTNLDPGDYTFKVIASNNDGIWNKSGASLSIIIHPPYWMTWWFKSSAIGFLLIIAAYAYQKRISNLKKETAAQQRFSKQLIDSQENERKRIASELHDGLGQNLLIINNRAKIALKKSDFDTAKTQIESISEIALESINDVRKIAYNLHPYHLDELGLTKTIQSTIGKSFETTDIRICQYVDFIDSIFKPEAEIHIFRIIQEGISNIIKHSAAKNVNITAKSESGQIIINITDDGKGMSDEFVKHSLKSSTGFGLKGMQERVRLINGNFQIISNEGKGTTLLVTVPVNLKNEKYD